MAWFRDDGLASHHTDSGIRRLADFPEQIAEHFEIPVADLESKAVGDPYAAVRIDVRHRPAHAPARPPRVGVVYDVSTGPIEVVRRAQ